VADFPRDPVPQVAMVGRSNVGKSSLINALAGSRIARTSAAPGKTRLVNLYLLELAARPLDRVYLVDLPGYGYARGGERSAVAFEALTTSYFAQPPWNAPGVRGGPTGPSAALLVVDARHPGLEADVNAMAWLAGCGRPVGVVASKIDKLSRTQRRRAEEAWVKALNVPVLPVSVVTGEGLKQLWTLISKLADGSPRAATTSR
jgi:GTP-binding protein